MIGMSDSCAAQGQCRGAQQQQQKQMEKKKKTFHQADFFFLPSSSPGLPPLFILPPTAQGKK